MDKKPRLGSDPLEYKGYKVVSQEALTGLLGEKGIISKEELLDMVKVVDQGRKRKGET